MNIYPNYYKEFKCIAGKCKHNCCIGWEIDIDEDTLGFYNCVEGEFGKTLKDNINYCDIPHFKLGKDERCPFLNENNLCDIIINLGEDALCDICTQHPRFHNELPDRVESGLGLCCEEACRLIITQKEKMTLVESLGTDDEIILLRDEIIEILQNRDKRIIERIDDILRFCEADYEKKSIKETCKILLDLEILDKSWKKTLLTLEDITTAVDYEKFYEYIKDREHEYEQFCVYLIYRHFANSPDLFEAKKRARFCAFAFHFFYFLGAFSYCTIDSYPTELQLDFMRQFSSEIEYSDENLHTLFDTV